MTDADRIAPLEDVPVDGTLLITLREGFDEREAILTREGEDVRGWLNYCQHWRDVRLDTGDGAPTRNGELLCQKHGATFDPGTGDCTYGPCEGARLETVDVTARDGTVYLTDEAYEFERRGPSADVDLSSRGRIDF